MIILSIDNCPSCGKSCSVLMAEIPRIGRIRESEYIKEIKDDDSVGEVIPTLSYIFLEYFCDSKNRQQCK